MIVNLTKYFKTLGRDLWKSAINLWSANDSLLFPSQFPPGTGDGCYDTLLRKVMKVPSTKRNRYCRIIKQGSTNVTFGLESMVGPAEVTRLALSLRIWMNCLLPFLALSLSLCLLTLFFVPFSDALKVPSCSHVINPPSA